MVDLQTQSYLGEIDLGPTGKNPEYMALKNNQLFTVNNRDFSAASISAVDLSSSAVTTVDLGITSGCGGSSCHPCYIFLPQKGDGMFSKVNRFPFHTKTMSCPTRKL